MPQFSVKAESIIFPICKELSLLSTIEVYQKEKAA